MRSIKQNQPALRITLPDFRNLGVHLRILVITNGLGIIAAILRAPNQSGLIDQVLLLSATIQPLLLASLLTLSAINPLLTKLHYGKAVIVVLMIELGLSTTLFNFLNGVFGSNSNLWAVLFFTLLISGLILYYFNLRSRALSPAITEARLQALQARIRPHFLFNSINAVLSIVRSDPKRAETALEDMADLFRVLMADNRELVNLETELALCRQYLDLEKLRLGDRLQISWHLDNMPADAQIPPLVLQPLIENAVYHGIEPYQSTGEININIYQYRNEVHIVLTNPYPKEGDHHTGNKMAMGNIRQRLALHFDAEAQLITKVSEHKYQVHIILPYRKENKK